jgi:hypothetical protein
MSLFESIFREKAARLGDILGDGERLNDVRFGMRMNEGLKSRHEMRRRRWLVWVSRWGEGGLETRLGCWVINAGIGFARSWRAALLWYGVEISILNVNFRMCYYLALLCWGK